MEEKRTFPIVFNINICNKHPSTCLTGGQYAHYNAMLCLTFGIPWFKWKGLLSVSGSQRMGYNKKLAFSLKKTASELYLPVLS